MTDRRSRKPNWTTNETRSLVERVACHKDFLFSKSRSSYENKKKMNAWKSITQAVCSHETAMRTVDEIRKKWKDLSSLCRRDLQARKFPPSGDEPRPQEGEWTSTILDLLGHDHPVFHRTEGAENGFSSSTFGIDVSPSKLEVQEGISFIVPDETTSLDNSVECAMTVPIDGQKVTSGIPNEENAIALVDDMISLKSETVTTTCVSPQEVVESTKKRRAQSPLRSMKQKAAKSEQASYEDLLAADVSRAYLESQKLKLETEKIQKEIKKIEKEEQKIDLQIKHTKSCIKKNNMDRKKTRVEIEKLQLECQVLKLQLKKNKLDVSSTGHS